jgi:hypothetical protein
MRLKIETILTYIPDVYWKSFMRLWYVDVVLTVAAIECISTTSIRFKGGIPMNECAESQNWLRVMPSRDNPGWVPISPAQVSDTWEEWIEKGRNISGIEECLLSFLAEEANAVTRSLIVLALGFVAGDRSIPTLMSILESDVPLVQMEAAASLGRLGNAEAVEALCKAIKSPDRNVRANACTSLGRIGGAKASECLIEATTDADPFVRTAAQAALQGHE